MTSDLRDLRSDIMLGNAVLKNFVSLSYEEAVKVLRWRNHKEIRRWMFTDHEISYDEHMGFIERLKNERTSFYWLARQTDGFDIGVISLNRLDFRNKNAYIGLYSNPEISGVGAILLDCLKTIAFDIAKLHTLRAEVIETNEKAIRLYKKSGFAIEGRLREFVFKDGKWLDVIVMGIINTS